jgi:ubiquinol-cytochrome c reductase iron-sulfur subunit
MVDDSRSLPTRRDFVSVSAGAFAAVGGAAALWPLVDQMNPNPGTPPGTRLVDLAPIAAGQAVTVAWRGQPVVIRHRTPDEIAGARSAAVGDLPDPFARNAALAANAPASDANRTRAGRPDWLVVVGLCTHLGCRLRALTRQTGDPIEREGGGWFCPCHAARFDDSGRVVSGPAPTNLPVPPYRFVTPHTMEIGRT